ncbi:MAG: demethoxyubiquinone hydroxylase family protein [Alphaproteobacteria bacterium CG_4_10_14_0_2_um_filter_63_37]|nr:MAG: demethoxyubiquinone hydroxylase family protein [Proteobacteria bacterium CG1_02_64_396]PJA26030.1 MAG: demethoxyubiquinone hydroxylase family protein [Alphaproteobacteria bacterium CG_4_10_14_0_2_um_filter_63_37]
MKRRPSLADRLIPHLDRALRTLTASPIHHRPDPGAEVEDPQPMTEAEKRHVIGLMRVNYAGEVAAQGLYQGQSLTANHPELVDKLHHAMNEEEDHLAWCADRVHELGGRVSLLNPIWYAGSVALGAAAGIAGDRWNLGFLAETEKQVVDHLQGHLETMPDQAMRAKAVVQQMQVDEGHHRDMALHHGGAELPEPIPSLMKLSSKLLTKGSYWI